MRALLFFIGLAVGIGASIYSIQNHYNSLVKFGLAPALRESRTITKTEVINNTENPCAWKESRSISFTSWEDSDVALVEVFGSNCDFSIISLTIRDQYERVIFHKIAELSGITPYPETEKDLPKIVERFWDVIGPSNIDEFSEMVALKEKHGEDEEGIELFHSSYSAALSADAPIICMQVHYEYTHCYWRNAERNSTERILSYSA